jgi:hypothetical protein
MLGMLHGKVNKSNHIKYFFYRMFIMTVLSVKIIELCDMKK